MKRIFDSIKKSFPKVRKVSYLIGANLVVLTQRLLNKESRNSNQEEHDCVRQQKRATAIGVTDIRKPGNKKSGTVKVEGDFLKFYCCYSSVTSTIIERTLPMGFSVSGRVA